MVLRRRSSTTSPPRRGTRAFSVRTSSSAAPKTAPSSATRFSPTARSALACRSRSASAMPGRRSERPPRDVLRHPRDRRARPPLGEMRGGDGARVGAAHRRELSRHGAFSLTSTPTFSAPSRTPRCRDYQAEVRRDVDEVWATDCKFFQPQASMAAKEGIMTDYIYRVGSPFVVMLYKTCVGDREPLGRDLPLRPADGGGLLPRPSGHVPDRRRHAARGAGRSSSSSSSCRTASSSKTSGRGCCRSSRARKSRRAPTSRPSPIAAGSRRRG